MHRILGPRNKGYRGLASVPLGFEVRTAKAPAAEREVEALGGWIARCELVLQRRAQWQGWDHSGLVSVLEHPAGHAIAP
jgi:hypothetical protein